LRKNDPDGIFEIIDEHNFTVLSFDFQAILDFVFMITIILYAESQPDCFWQLCWQPG
jgi:hypothetical protein